MMINQAKTENVEDEALASVENEYWVELKNSLDRLEQNEDFIKLIREGYFKDKAIKGVSLLATDYVRQNGLRPEIMESLVAISALEDYFIMIQNLGAPEEFTAEDLEEDEE